MLPLNVFPAATAAAAVGNADAPASGSWRVVDRRDGEVRMAVVDRPGRPPLDEIVFRSYADAGALEDALASGAVDVAAGFSPGDYARVQAIRGASAIHANDGDQWAMQLRVGDPALRRAIAQAVDRDRLVEDVVKGVGRAPDDPGGRPRRRMAAARIRRRAHCVRAHVRPRGRAVGWSRRAPNRPR